MLVCLTVTVKVLRSVGLFDCYYEGVEECWFV